MACRTPPWEFNLESDFILKNTTMIAISHDDVPEFGLDYLRTCQLQQKNRDEVRDSDETLHRVKAKESK